jgi:hypothetical protein
MPWLRRLQSKQVCGWILLKWLKCTIFYAVGDGADMKSTLSWQQALLDATLKKKKKKKKKKKGNDRGYMILGSDDNTPKPRVTNTCSKTPRLP